MKRAVLLTAGYVLLVIGAAGIVLPLLPGTPLLILAACCFARSSPSLHQWLRTRPGVGPVIQRWEEARAIPISTKRHITIALTVPCAISSALMGTPLAVAGFVVLNVLLLTYIWSRPSSPITHRGSPGAQQKSIQEPAS